MSSTALASAALDRKARLAQLKSQSLKRKTPSSPNEAEDHDESTPSSTTLSAEVEETSKPTDLYLSGRNFDTSTRGPKLGFEQAPSDVHANQTVESRALELSTSAREESSKELTEGQDAMDLDLFKLRPKKPNWDLKRDLERKLEVLDVRTDNAIAQIVRERIEARKQTQGQNKITKEGGEEEVEGDGGIEGGVLVEALKEREREAEEDALREKRLDEDDG